MRYERAFELAYLTVDGKGQERITDARVRALDIIAHFDITCSYCGAKKNEEGRCMMLKPNQRHEA